MIKRMLKNEKGLTLIELLAVVVILGIIAAIAIPAIGGIIDNSKKDAHVANATQMINSAKLAVSGDTTARPANGQTTYISLNWLIEQGYIEQVQDPDDKSQNYVEGSGISTAVAAPTGASYVKVAAGDTGALTYEVLLVGNKRGIHGANAGDYVAETALDRSAVKAN